MTATSVDTQRTRTPSVLSGGVVAAGVAAAAFVLEGALSVVHPTGDDHWDALSQLLNAAYALAALALIAALPSLRRWLRLGRVGTVGVGVAQLGCAAMVVESVVSGVHDGNTLGGLFFGGLVLALLGTLVLGGAGMASGHRRWGAMLPFLGLLVGVAGGDHGGSIVTGVVWAVIAAALRRPDGR
jgi:hypothetical protein